MKLVTWNIQWGLGCDGKVDLARIADVTQDFGNPDVICFQEISHGFPPHDGGQDQPAVISSYFPGYEAVFRPAVEMRDASGQRQVFGNMVLSRLPVLQVTSHMLPWPATDVKSMQRQALEVTVASVFGPVRVTTCHLEYHAFEHREAQVERLRTLHEEGIRRDRLSFRDTSEGPYRTLAPAVGAVVCGDFNFEPDDALHRRMTAPFPADIEGFVDAWAFCHGSVPHAPTTGVADAAQWPQGPHCRDYVFVSNGIADRIEAVQVDVDTTASDHQPVVIVLRD